MVKEDLLFRLWRFTAKAGLVSRADSAEFVGDRVSLWLSLASDNPTMQFIHLTYSLFHVTRHKISDLF